MSSSAFTSYVNDEGLITAMHVVRKNGNCGAHGEIISVQTARETLEQLQFVVGEFCLNLGIIKDYPMFVSPLEPKSDRGGQKPATRAVTPIASAP